MMMVSFQFPLFLFSLLLLLLLNLAFVSSFFLWKKNKKNELKDDDNFNLFIYVSCDIYWKKKLWNSIQFMIIQLIKQKLSTVPECSSLKSLTSTRIIQFFVWWLHHRDHWADYFQFNQMILFGTNQLNKQFGLHATTCVFILFIVILYIFINWTIVLCIEYLIFFLLNITFHIFFCWLNSEIINE